MKSPQKDQDEYRYEKKFVIPLHDISEVEPLVLINRFGIVKSFPERTICNIYLDSPLWKCYTQHTDGIHERFKCRIRWYAQLRGMVENPILEIKVKKGLAGHKLRYPLHPFEINDDLTPEHFHKLLQESNIPEELKEELQAFHPCLMNTYRRRYYRSFDRRLRITLDWDVRNDRPRTLGQGFPESQNFCDRVIMELKYAPSVEEQVLNICKEFPFRLTAYSKFLTGIDALTD